MAELAFCPKCGKQVEFSTAQRKRMTEVEGRRYRYDALQAICGQCGAEATYPPYQEAAGKAFNEAVRRDLGLVSLERILELPKRYAIGKRPLSKVLGLGEHTYSQIMAGQAPSKAHSDLIDRVYNDPCYFRSLLEEHKGLINEHAYDRSSEAVDALLQNDYPDAYHIYELGRAFVYFAKGDITGKAIQKLTYYVQGFSVAFFGRFIIRKMPSAWVGGPVYGQMWYEYRNDAASYFAYDADEDYSSPFTAEEDVLVQAVYEHFGCYSGDTLASMTHMEAPWLNARSRANAQPGDQSKEPISEADMREFFQGVVRTYAMAKPNDIGRYARDAFEKAR